LNHFITKDNHNSNTAKAMPVFYNNKNTEDENILFITITVIYNAFETISAVDLSSVVSYKLFI